MALSVTSHLEFKLCRLCLCRGHGLMDIFSVSCAMDYSVAETIQDLLAFRAVQSPDFPWLVCSTCMTKLSEFRLFKQQCQECKMAFESRFMGMESRIKEEEVGNAQGSDVKSLSDASVQRDEEEDSRHIPPTYDVPQDKSPHFAVSLKEEGTEDSERLSNGIPDETEDEPRPKRPQLESVGPLALPHCQDAIMMEELDVVEVNQTKEEGEEDFTIEDEIVPSENECLGNVDETTSDESRATPREPMEAVQKRPSRRTSRKYSDEVEVIEVAMEGTPVVPTDEDSPEEEFPFVGEESNRFRGGKGPDCCVTRSTVKTVVDLRKRKKMTVKKMKSNTSPSGLPGDHSLRCNSTLPSVTARPFKCDTCGKTFNRRFGLTRHSVVHSILRPFKCDTCGKGFNYKTDLVRHSSVHSGLVPFKCDTCDKGFNRKSDLVRHSVVHSGLRPYKCDTCGKGFKYKFDLVHHSVMHSGLVPFKCDTCGKGFYRKSHLVTHSVVHSGLRPFRCDTCGKGFNNKYYLVQHSLVHSELRPFKCDTCGKGFNGKANLVKHSVVHSRLRPFKCDICGKGFSQKVNLRRHSMLHCSVKPFKATHKSK